MESPNCRRTKLLYRASEAFRSGVGVTRQPESPTISAARQTARTALDRGASRWVRQAWCIPLLDEASFYEVEALFQVDDPLAQLRLEPFGIFPQSLDGGVQIG